MVFKITFWNKEKYLPTKRHRVLRERYVENSAEVEIAEPTEVEFPIAFIVKDYDWFREEEGDNPEYKKFAAEIRTYNGRLWKAIRYSEWVCNAVGWLPISYLQHRLDEHTPYWKGGDEFTDRSIIKETNLEECKEKALRKAEHYLIFEGKVWQTCEEPMYVINTFGLGHNHGGTGFFVAYHYNSNINKNNYFNALQRDEAIAYGRKVAANRGDTESIDRIGKYNMIEVLMPEMVKRNPQAEHGDGDVFLNSLETMICETKSSTEAGWLAMAMCMKNL